MVTNSGGHEALRLDGSKIDWGRPPEASTRVRWSKRDWDGDEVTGSLRTICHLNRLNNLAVSRGWKQGLVIIQPPYNSGVAASVGTHDLDCVVDCYLPDIGWWAAQRFLRANGMGCWYRHPPKFGNHIHALSLPPREGRDVSDDFRSAGLRVGLYVDGGWSTRGGRVASSQIEDYYNHAFGLAGMHVPGSDKSWFPADISKTIFNLNSYIKHRQTVEDDMEPGQVTKAVWDADRIGVPKGRVEEESRQKNPTWQADNALADIWRYTREAAVRSRQINDRLGKIIATQKTIIEKADNFSDAEKAQMEKLLADVAIDVDVNVHGPDDVEPEAQ